MLNEITKIKAADIIAAAKEGESITIIINGEYYDFTTEGADDLEKAFIEGVKFAAAVIEDNRARRSKCFEWIEGSKPRTPKKAFLENQARNNEVKILTDFLLNHVTNFKGYNPFYEDYKNNNLWKL